MARREDFAVGMRVKCVADFDIPGQFTIGTHYIVRSIGEHFLGVELDDDGRTDNGWSFQYFEPAPEPRAFQVGDRVRCLAGNRWGVEGSRGVITQIDLGGHAGLTHRVKQDDHDYDLWMDPTKIELTEAAPEVEQPDIEPMPNPVVYVYVAYTKHRERNTRSAISHTDENRFNEMLRAHEAQGFITLAKKRIKFNL